MTASATTSTPPKDAASYVRNTLHTDEERSWLETNCYVDLWIELVHALRLDPIAMFGFTIAMDFEGDQWTFFKPSLSDLYTLYGIDVQELTLWRPLLPHTIEQTARGRAVLAEVDAFFLPDTAGVSYKIAHTKTTIAARVIDPETRTLSYFHNAGYFTVTGDDFDGLFRVGAYPPPADLLAPYVEIAKFDNVRHLPLPQLAETANALARVHFDRRPRTNPITQYRERFTRDLTWLGSEPMETFHQYAFATLRQCGACAEMAATFLRWLAQHLASANTEALETAATAFQTIATGAKTLQFKVARSVNTKKPFDSTPMFDAMEQAWDTAMAQLTAVYGA